MLETLLLWDLLFEEPELNDEEVDDLEEQRVVWDNESYGEEDEEDDEE